MEYIRNIEGRVGGWGGARAGGGMGEWGGGARPTPLYSLYIPHIFLNIFHICSLVCFLIYGVNRRQVLGFLEDFALTWSFWDMMDMSMFRLLVHFRTLWLQNLFFSRTCLDDFASEK